VIHQFLCLLMVHRTIDVADHAVEGCHPLARRNSLYIDAAVKQLEAGAMGIKGGRISPEIRARLSPLGFEHINFHGFYPFHRPDLGEGLRDLRDPAARQEED
jgi:hypothetical protein